MRQWSNAPSQKNRVCSLVQAPFPPFVFLHCFAVLPQHSLCITHLLERLPRSCISAPPDGDSGTPSVITSLWLDIRIRFRPLSISEKRCFFCCGNGAMLHHRKTECVHWCKPHSHPPFFCTALQFCRNTLCALLTFWSGYLGRVSPHRINATAALPR